MKTSNLDLDDDPKFQAKMRPVQLAAWMALVCFVLAAILGFFGKSSLTVETSKRGALSLEYARYLRQQTSDQLRIELKLPVAPRPKTASIWVSREFLDEADVQFVNPQPVAVETDGDEDRFDFNVSEKTEVLKLSVQFAPRSAGPLRGHVRAAEDLIRFNQLTYF